MSMRTTGHGVAAGIGKLGAFVGVFLVPVLQDHIGLRGLLAVAGVSAVVGFAVTGLLPEPAGRTLEDVADHRSDAAAPEPVRVVATDDLTSRELRPRRSEPARSRSNRLKLLGAQHAQGHCAANGTVGVLVTQ